MHKERSLSVSSRLPQFTVENNVLEFLNDLEFIFYLKYDNFSTTWCMTRLPLLPIIYVRAHYIIQRDRQCICTLTITESLNHKYILYTAMSTWKTELNNDCNDVKEMLLINKLTSDHKFNATEVNSKSPCNSRCPGTFSSFSSVSSWPRVYFRGPNIFRIYFLDPNPQTFRLILALPITLTIA